MRTVFRLIADEHLHWAFGVLPLISDIKKIFKIISTFDKVFDGLLSNRQRTYRYGHETGLVDWPMNQPSVGGQVPGSTMDIGKYKGVGKQWATHLRRDLFCEWKGYLGYHLRSPEFVNGPLGGLLVFLDTFGVQPDPEIIWDAIPYSFVVDWFISIGEELHKYEVDLVPVTMTVTDAMHQVRLRLYRDWYYRTSIVDDDLHWQFTESISFFLRRRYLPVATEDVLLKRLGLKQLLLGLSLAAVRRSK
jgi:hypothetical protein